MIKESKFDNICDEEIIDRFIECWNSDMAMGNIKTSFFKIAHPERAYRTQFLIVDQFLLDSRIRNLLRFYLNYERNYILEIFEIITMDIDLNKWINSEEQNKYSEFLNDLSKALLSIIDFEINYKKEMFVFTYSEESEIIFKYEKIFLLKDLFKYINNRKELEDEKMRFLEMSSKTTEPQVKKTLTKSMELLNWVDSIIDRLEDDDGLKNEINDILSKKNLNLLQKNEAIDKTMKIIYNNFRETFPDQDSFDDYNSKQLFEFLEETRTLRNFISHPVDLLDSAHFSKSFDEEHAKKLKAALKGKMNILTFSLLIKKIEKPKLREVIRNIYDPT